MNIVLIAPPAAGKGTQAKLICDKYQLKHLSTGDMLRERIKREDELSKRIQEKISNGFLISDELIFQLITEEFKKNNGFVLDGFPRNLTQAKQFDEILSSIHQKIDYIIYLEIDKEIAKKRIVGRMVCPNCKNVYNYDLDQINLEHVCDCGSILVKREDDTVQTFMKRLEIYEKETRPIIDYYKERDNFYLVDSNLKVDQVFQQIDHIIGEK